MTLALSESDQAFAARLSVDEIFVDISERFELGSFWETIPGHIKEQIRENWELIIQGSIAGVLRISANRQSDAGLNGLQTSPHALVPAQ